MKTADIEIDGRYAAYFGANVFEIGQVKVFARGSIPGTVDVEVIHPEDQRANADGDDERDFRTIETKKLLGWWTRRPIRQTNQTNHVSRDENREYRTFAEHHDWAYTRVQTQRELAGRLQALGVDYPKVAWLGRGGSRFYTPEFVREFGLDHDTLSHLLFLAEGGRR